MYVLLYITVVTYSNLLCLIQTWNQLRMNAFNPHQDQQHHHPCHHPALITAVRTQGQQMQAEAEVMFYALQYCIVLQYITFL